MNTTEPNHAANLFGGLTATVVHEDGSTESVKVRQLPLRDYERALPLLNDEFAITAFCCVRSAAVPAAGTSPSPETVCEKPWILTLQPHSYTELVDKVEECNKRGFFSFAARKAERDRAEKQEMLHVLAELPPDAVKAFSEASRSLSTAPSPAPRSH